MLPVLNRRRELLNDPFDWFDRDLDRMLGRWWNEPRSFGGAYPVDIWEDDDNVHVEAEMPGFKKDEIDITLEQGILNITAERKQTEEQGPEGHHLRERRFSRYQRSFTLPTSVDESGCDATLEDGVLHLTFPKTPEVKPRRIAVK